MGDVTGDGVADLVVAAPEADSIDNARSNAGEAYVISGAAGISGIVDLADFSNTAVVSRIYGAQADDQLVVLEIGDVTGDGVGDIVLGAPGDDTLAADGGAIYIVTGGAGLVATSTVDLATPPGTVNVLAIYGDGAGGSFGETAAVGDFGGSPAPDLLTGDSGYDVPDNNRGAAWGFFGPLTVAPTLAMADVRWIGQDINVKLGERVAIGNVAEGAAGDAVITSIQHRKLDGFQYGAADVWTGPIAPGTTFDLSAGATPRARVIASDQFDNLGQSLALGDWNNDGFLDIAVAASTADGPGKVRDRAGEIYVVVGGPSLPAETDIGATPPLVRIYGDRVRALLGHQPSSIVTGDLNGDGFADICVGEQLGGSTPTLFEGRVDCIINPF